MKYNNEIIGGRHGDNDKINAHGESHRHCKLCTSRHLHIHHDIVHVPLNDIPPPEPSHTLL